MRHRSPSVRIAGLCAAVLLCIAPRATTATDWSALGYAPGEVHSITIDRYGFAVVPGTVAGRRLGFVWDTGNLTGLLIGRRTAARLGLRATGASRHSDADGRALGERTVFRVEGLRVLGREWPALDAHADPRDEFDGLLGPRFAAGGRFTLDWRARRIAVAIGPLPAAADADTSGWIPMVPVPGLEGLIVIPARVNGRRVLAQLDTGKSRTCVDPALVMSLALPSVPRGFRIDRVEFGGRRFAVPSAKEVGFAGISAGLEEPILLGIGADLLARTVLTVDYAGRRVRFD